jgi:hypothetical protein
MSTVVEPTMIGLTERTHAGLKKLKEDEHFNQMLDAYRFVDQNKEIYTAIKSIMETGDTPVYRWAERLAEWGVNELIRQAESGEIDFPGIFQKVEEASQG